MKGLRDDGFFWFRFLFFSVFFYFRISGGVKYIGDLGALQVKASSGTTPEMLEIPFRIERV